MCSARPVSPERSCPSSRRRPWPGAPGGERVPARAPRPGPPRRPGTTPGAVLGHRLQPATLVEVPRRPSVGARATRTSRHRVDRTSPRSSVASSEARRSRERPLLDGLALALDAEPGALERMADARVTDARAPRSASAKSRSARRRRRPPRPAGPRRTAPEPAGAAPTPSRSVPGVHGDAHVVRVPRGTRVLQHGRAPRRAIRASPTSSGGAPAARAASTKAASESQARGQLGHHRLAQLRLERAELIEGQDLCAARGAREAPADRLVRALDRSPRATGLPSVPRSHPPHDV